MFGAVICFPFLFQSFGAGIRDQSDLLCVKLPFEGFMVFGPLWDDQKPMAVGDASPCGAVPGESVVAGFAGHRVNRDDMRRSARRCLRRF
ncbi:hypothetical protein J4558_01555 [Leptolyngbya sp. 15MV]|nr:hypothetical protein J4558_01555 [Leptolyngbya sp. 15MV]